MLYDVEKDKKNIEKEEKSGLKRILLEYVRPLAIIVLAVFLLQEFVIVNARIPSASMENTIMTGERLFGNRLAYLFGDPERYDIIIFKYPDDESQLFIKRVIGLPGETVIIMDGKVYAANEYIENPNADGHAGREFAQELIDLEDTILLDDSFIKEPMNEDEIWVFAVPEDSYFVLGDNRNNSSDSRYWNDHFVSEDEILGEAGFRYWPLNKISIIGYDGERI